MAQTDKTQRSCGCVFCDLGLEPNGTREGKPVHVHHATVANQYIDPIPCARIAQRLALPSKEPRQKLTDQASVAKWICCMPVSKDTSLGTR
jgi:hypothetical protein